jgi:serine/threonine protein phosphatase 1
MLYAIGDIHGMIDKMQSVLSKIPIQKSDTLIFLGDYIDRGPNSKEVIDECILLSKKYKTIFLKGNHEDLFLRSSIDTSAFECWIYNGGMATQKSYKNGFPKEHYEFLKTLKLFHKTNKYYFVHAGVNPMFKLEDQDEEDLLWIRDNFLYSDRCYDKLIIHGHSITSKPEVKPNRIGIDTGSFLPFGKITCLDVYRKKFYFSN